MMRYFSMFTGIGGFELGIQRACDRAETTEGGEILLGNGTDLESGLGDGGRQRTACIGYSEIDKYAIQTYERHFNGHNNYGDATAINPAEIGDFDLLCGGFPCQAFSVAGKRLGFNETRGTLFFDIARILEHKRPGHLVLENVKGLLSHDSGKTFQTILGVLADLGYRVEWQVLNSKDFGVPQNRERVYIIGHSGIRCGRQVFPITGSNSKDTRIIGQDVAYTIDANYSKGTNTLEKGRRSVVATRQPLRFLNRNQKNIEGDYAYTVDASQTSGVKLGTRIRRLTPKECERLQGFPDDWTAGVSDTQRYRQCGNAVTVNVVGAVMTGLLDTGCLQ